MQLFTESCFQKATEFIRILQGYVCKNEHTNNLDISTLSEGGAIMQRIPYVTFNLYI